MSKRVLAIRLDPAFADYSTMSNLTPEIMRAYLQQQLDVVRSAGYDVVDCPGGRWADGGVDAERHASGRFPSTAWCLAPEFAGRSCSRCSRSC